MNRLGLIHPSTLTGRHNSETAAVYQAFNDHANQHLGGAHITYRYPSTGAMVGQFGILLHSPPIGRAFLDLTATLRELPGLSQRAREIIALVVAANENAAFMSYAHGRLAADQGLTDGDIRALRAGLYPSSFTDEDKATYRVARELCVSSGPLAERTWNEASEVLGRDGLVAVVHIVAFQRFEATILRGFDAQVPSSRDRVEGVEGDESVGGV